VLYCGFAQNLFLNLAMCISRIKIFNTYTAFKINDESKTALSIIAYILAGLLILFAALYVKEKHLH